MTRYRNKQTAALLLLFPLLTLFACAGSPTAAPTLPSTLAAAPVPSATSLPAPSATIQTTAAATSAAQATAATPTAVSIARVPAATVAPSDTVVPGTPTTVVGTPEIQATIVFGSGDFDFPDPTAGLADLSSYRATLTVAFDGTSDGKPQKWSETDVMLFSKSSAFRQLTVAKTGDASDTGPAYQAELDGVSYEVDSDNECVATTLQAKHSLGDQSEPASFLTGVIGVDAAGSASINGIETNHYTFDERALGQLGTTQSTGELWVAANGGYLSKYLLTSKGNEDYFGKGMAGTLTLDYELTDVGKPQKLQLPADCPPGLVNLPMLPDASNVDQSPGAQSFDTHSSLQETVAFYQKQLPGLGWKANGVPIVTDTSAGLTYAKGNQELSISLQTNSGITSVDINLIATPP